ncbi:MAG: C25 family cysteine peptidase, partial [Bacteroidota bacterium]
GEGYVGAAFNFGQSYSLQVPSPYALNGSQSLTWQARVFAQSNTQHRHRISTPLEGGLTLKDSAHGNSSVFVQTYQGTFTLNGPIPASVPFTFEALHANIDENRFLDLSLQYDRLPHWGLTDHQSFYRWQSSQAVYFQFSHVIGLDSLWAFDQETGVRISGRIQGQIGQIILPPISGPQNLLFFSDQAIQTPLISRPALNKLGFPQTGPELLIITDRQLAGSAQAYAQYRDTLSLQPLSTQVIYTDHIFDEFGYGHWSPYALRRFINYALDHWSPAPQSVLIWGKGSYQAREFPQGAINVPTHGYPASDWYLVAEDSAQSPLLRPRIPIGRVPIMNDQEGFDYLAKVDTFEHTPWEGWRQKGVFLGGGISVGEQNAIDAGLQYVMDQFSAFPFYGIAVHYQATTPATTVPPAVDAAISGGVGSIQLFGHTVLPPPGDIPLQTPDQYNNQGRFPLLIGFAGASNDFSQSTHSFAEDWLLYPQKGAIAYLANSCPGYLNPLKDYLRVFHPNLWEQMPLSSVGEVMLTSFLQYEDSLQGIQYRNHARQINLLGDPNLVIVSQAVNVSVDPVWPGDTNDDGLCELADLLPIGLAYGENGPSRLDTSLSWTPHDAPAWTQTGPDSVNFKHRDTDGNGTIHALDTLAIHLNLSQVHNKTQQEFVAGGLPLTIVSPDQASKGDTVIIAVSLGDSSSTDSVYGLVFTLQYDAEVVADSSLRVLSAGSGFGVAGQDMLYMYRQDALNGEVEIAITRINQQALLAQHLKVVDISIVITDDIAKKEWGPLQVQLKGGYAQDANGQALPMDKREVQANLFGGAGPLAVGLYPNPSAGRLFIQPGAQPWKQLEVVDLQGRSLLTVNEVRRPTEWDLSHLPAGLYLVRWQVGVIPYGQKWLKK